MCRAQTGWNFQQRFCPQLALTLAVSGENNANTSWRQVAEKLWTQFVNRIQGEAWGRCYLGTYLVLPRYIDLKIVATKWKLTAVSIGKRGSRASGCLQCEDGRSGFWAPPSLQSATSASFTGHRFFRLSSPNSRSLAVESWKESSKSDSDPLLQQVFSFFHRSIEWAIF